MSLINKHKHTHINKSLRITPTGGHLQQRPTHTVGVGRVNDRFLASLFTKFSTTLLVLISVKFPNAFHSLSKAQLVPCSLVCSR